MTVVDTSVLVAVVLGENDVESFLPHLLDTDVPLRTSTVTYVEASLVLEARQGADAVRDLLLLMQTCQITVEPVTVDQADAAIVAWRRFGKGRHPAALNLGDCFSYALARDSDEPLLFKGDDFAQTDIRSAR